MATGVIRAGVPFAFEQIIVSTTAVALTAATYAPTGEPQASAARVVVDAQPIRYRIDGDANPSATVGHIAAAGTVIELGSLTEIKRFKAIRSGGTDATIAVTYFRRGKT